MLNVISTCTDTSIFPEFFPGMRCDKTNESFKMEQLDVICIHSGWSQSGRPLQDICREPLTNHINSTSLS